MRTNKDIRRRFKREYEGMMSAALSNPWSDARRMAEYCSKNHSGFLDDMLRDIEELEGEIRKIKGEFGDVSVKN